MLHLVLQIAFHPLMILLCVAVPMIIDCKDWYSKAMDSLTNMSSESGVDLLGERRLEDEGARAAVIIWLVVFLVISILVPIVITIIFGIVHKQKVTDQRGAPPTQGNLETLAPGTICNCWIPCITGFDCNLCLYTCCCWEVRAADTFGGAQLVGFWTVMFAFFIEWIIYEVINFVISFLYMMAMENADSNNNPGHAIGWWVATFLMAFWLAGKRGQLRKMVGGSENFGLDFICYWCCQPCSLAQDAKMFDEASNVLVTCCCNMIKKQTSAPAVVGTVVGVGQPESNKAEN